MYLTEDYKAIKLQITRTVNLPDPVKVARFKKNPELGPKLLFFSGGTALRDLSKHLINYTWNSIHIITPFDSGGSSAELRKKFKMPAVGDIRNRLMALADQSFQGNPDIYSLFAYRLPKDKNQHILMEELYSMAKGKHPMVVIIVDPMRKIIRNHLYLFLEKISETFDLRGASIGNVILTAGYLSNRRLFDPVIFIFSKLVECRGIVRPIVNKYRHLAAELEDGTVLIGQHLLVGKESARIQSRVKKVFLTDETQKPLPVDVPIRKKMRSLISQADLICYPMGSFYSSIIANLLPKGVGDAVSQVDCPKVYIPNTCADPETHGMTLADQVKILLIYLKKDNPKLIGNKRVLNYVLVDNQPGTYPGGIDKEGIKDLGVQIIDYPIVTSRTSPQIDEQQLICLLLSLC
ncbi:MAG: GAK system CofD-like protein [Desulfobacteraceae bacterium]|nr:GAK system CofD-like protein [Desulfobacteraceae bacterium]MBC2754376.1 GAK system CofD-like protein [Desulfobacteraceae bacterium]